MSSGDGVVGCDLTGRVGHAVADVGVEPGEQQRERLAERLRVHGLLVVRHDHEPVLGDDRDLAALLLQLDVERPDEHEPVADRHELHVAEADLRAALLVVLQRDLAADRGFQLGLARHSQGSFGERRPA